MGAGQVPPDERPPARVEPLHQSERTRITRVLLPGRAVICKEPLGPDAERRLWHERSILERLQGVEGVTQLATTPAYPRSIVLQDLGGASLAGLAKPVAAARLIALAIELSRAVAGMHRHGVMHCNISPANIVVAGDGAPCLVDFALASPLGEIRPEFTHHSEMLGTLAYLAPEQTGRTGRSVDQRSDLYALGATLYELATGEPPFGSGDPLRLIHDHLAALPVPPAEVNPTLPSALSEIVMHLLDKDPDSRYQTADGLLYDLERLRDVPEGPRRSVLRVGENDFAMRLLPPSHLVGRDEELATLRAAFEDALLGRCCGVLVGGAAGVGKTALLDQLRTLVTGEAGWFVAGKFDQYRRDLEFDAGYQAFRALGRLLLAEPEEELDRLRAEILRAVGANAALLTAVVPEFSALLAVPPDPGDPLTAQVRIQRTCLQVLRAVASRRRPVVLCIDDLHWAGRTPLGFIDLVLSDEPVKGLLLVAAYREEAIEGPHPLAAPLLRWREQPRVRCLRLVNLPLSGSSAMIAEILHVELNGAAALAEAIEPQAEGNPYATVELLDAVRRDGLLTATAAGWQWDEASVHAHFSQPGVDGLPAARIAALPPPSRHMLEAMACLGGRAELRLLQTALGAAANEVDEMLAPILEEGLLVMQSWFREAVRFRHDQFREAILDQLRPEQRRALQLAMARRLASAPELFAVTAEQYLPVADAVEDAAERRQVVGLLRRAAGQARLVGDNTLVNALLSAALPLVDSSDTATRVAVHTARHTALFSLGRLEQADDEYQMIAALCPGAAQGAAATAVQVRSLTYRNRFGDAIVLGTGALRECGLPVPAADRLPIELDRRFDGLYRWLENTPAADDLARAELTDPVLLAASGLIDATLPAAFFATDRTMYGWLSLEALRILIEHGPAPALVGSASRVTWAAMTLRDDPAAGYRAVRRILQLGEHRGYEPGTSEARSLFAVQSCWFEPLPVGIQAAQLAREGLIAAGDLANAGYTYHLASAALLDCAPTLHGCAAEVESGLAFVRRSGGEHLGQWLDTYQVLIDVLRGASAAEAAPPAPLESYAANPVALFHAHVNRAVAAAIFGDATELERHTAAAMTLLPAALGLYPTALAHVLRGLAVAAQVRTADGLERTELLTELEEVTRWLADRATDAPDNFLHMLRLVEAERAWSNADFRGAALAFDAALRSLTEQRRPWHRALIAERAAQLYLAQGLEHVGYELLAQARRDYLAWGATAKVDQLDWSYPTLRPRPDVSDGRAGDRSDDAGGRPPTVTRGALDLLGILSASQALSSQTSVQGLHTRVVEILSAMTGATGVRLALWRSDPANWLVPVPDNDGDMVPVTPGVEPAIPISVLRYVQRTQEPLSVVDAARDDRFARDPYFADIDCCSLLVVPISSRGKLLAALLLENRLIRGAFTSGRLDAVRLIAGQLAASLENAQLYAEFRELAEEQAALRRVATLVARGATPSVVFDTLAAEMEALLNANGISLCRYEDGDELTVLAHRGAEAAQLPPGTRVRHDGESVSATVRRTRRPARVDNYDQTGGHIGHVIEGLRFAAGVGAPITADGRLWGVTIANWVGDTVPPPDTEHRVAKFTDLVATAIANTQAQEELIASRARIVASGDETRRRIVRDLHDGAQERLVHTIITLKLAQRAQGSGDERTANALVNEALGHAERANSDLHELVHGILPDALTRSGLVAGVKELASRVRTPVTVRVPQERFPLEIEGTAYFVIAEALTNVTKHARAGNVEVSAWMADDALHLEVRDDGVGGARTDGSGLRGLSDRVGALGGQLSVHSPAGEGTRVAAMLPLRG